MMEFKYCHYSHLIITPNILFMIFYDYLWLFYDYLWLILFMMKNIIFHYFKLNLGAIFTTINTWPNQLSQNLNWPVKNTLHRSLSKDWVLHCNIYLCVRKMFVISELTKKKTGRPWKRSQAFRTRLVIISRLSALHNIFFPLQNWC